MNPFSIPIYHLNVYSYEQGVIPREVIEQAEQAHDIVENAKHQAEQIQLQAQRDLDRAQLEIEDMHRQAIAEAEQTAAFVVQQAKDVAISQSIDWIADEVSLEKVIALQMGEKIRALIAQAVREYAALEDVSEILLRRLSKPVEEQLKKGSVDLMVHPEVLPKLSQKVAKGDGLNLIADASLTVKQARLETPLVRVELDLERHLQHIIDKLLSMPEAMAVGELCGG
ncbi:hypothetical protein M9194_20100 [Vibrio sp. S4M6]|uniref:hypothetical protein n=1 Tax=Vibrio sinus TaxID=2946865 RepID=UPI00202A0C37|nr:hypothetical protein [Vibrio sinus]MCL9783731.1 hypothetical protein [Vibrio sinus]